MGLNKPLLSQRLVSPDHKALFLGGLLTRGPFWVCFFQPYTGSDRNQIQEGITPYKINGDPVDLGSLKRIKKGYPLVN